MPRIRYIKPDFFKDEDLAQLPPLYRIAFAGLWCQADKEGRLKDRPGELKVEILPYDNIDFNKVLNVLAQPKKINNSSSFITRYTINAQKYIQIDKFCQHQRPHHTEKESLIPPIPLTVKTRRKSVNKRTYMEKGMGMEKGMESVHSKSEPLNNFEKFWQAYPKKKSKGQAEKAFQKIKPNEQLLATMLAKIEQAKTSVDWLKDNGQFIPYPATWLNAKGWEDEIRASFKNPKCIYDNNRVCYFDCPGCEKAKLEAKVKNA